MTDLSHASEKLDWQKSALERSDKAFLALARLAPVEVRPIPKRMTVEERVEFFKESCKSSEYIDSTKTTNGHYVITDNLGQITEAPNWDDAVELAAEKWKRGNE